MKIFAAGVNNEVNSFSPIRATRDDFLATSVMNAGDDISTFDIVKAWRHRASGRQMGFSQSVDLFAMPSGPVTRSAYEGIRAQILDDLKQGMPVDIVLLALHGAMMADGYDDCEGDLIQAVRAIVGQDVVIGVELDPHAHLSPMMLGGADIIVEYKEWPHDDQIARAEELFDLAIDAAHGNIKPHMFIADFGALISFPTKDAPGKDFVDLMKALEKEPRVLSVSINQGFGWSDCVDIGTKFLVVTDNAPDVGARVATRLADALKPYRDQLIMFGEAISVPEALNKAHSLAMPGKPVALCECADIITGGAPGDATHLLKTLVMSETPNALLAPLWDPIAADIAATAGEGTCFEFRLGGKSSRFSGTPVDVKATVERVVEDYWHDVGWGMKIPAGTLVRLRTDFDLDIVVTQKRCPLMAPSLLSDCGVDVTSKRILGLKALQMARLSFADLVDHFILLSTPAACSNDYSVFPYEKFDKAIWPFNAS